MSKKLKQIIVLFISLCLFSTNITCIKVQANEASEAEEIRLSTEQIIQIGKQEHRWYKIEIPTEIQDQDITITIMPDAKFKTSLKYIIYSNFPLEKSL